ncbi:tRNA uridine(34) 5-carboxymethylaminomethyl modification radical SAM/GNAT enzyme Elp3 [Candidatus Microgenomates bacterium]|nr:tRNA uridine(34) 5-carboxymethylaminomethyl modification radical SAM/GNAT enzyme Elp3 [Candidatus Microgenomates bacterium]
MKQALYPENFPRPLKAVNEAALQIWQAVKKNKNYKKEEFLNLVRRISSDQKLPSLPSWALYLLYFRQKKLTPSLLRLLKIKNVRSWSGIVPVSIFTKNFGCPARCVFCPTEARVPKSYFSDEPAVMRAIRNKYDPFKQVLSRLTQLFLSGHSVEKIELIIQGGTFSAINRKYRENFVKRAFDAANVDTGQNLLINNYPVLSEKSLLKSQKRNETAKQRIVGITVETRPDWCTDEEIKFLKSLGVTRVELGVQSLNDEVLDKVKRGHGIKEVIKATKALKDAGFKVCYHMMPGLPGATPKSDLLGFKKLFSDPSFCPDLLKIYPCVVTRDAELTKWYLEKKYIPYDDRKLLPLLVEIKKIIPHYVRILRLVRDIPATDIIAGSKLSNLRQNAQAELTRLNKHCRCVRCREVKIGNLGKATDLKLRITSYQASGGEEYFLEYIDPQDETLYALLRLRFPSFLKTSQKPLFPVLADSSIVRELHTYGLALPLGKKKKTSSQHKGLGQKLLEEAERITLQNGLKKISVISGIGAREYYRKFGYQLKEGYMVKYFTNAKRLPGTN